MLTTAFVVVLATFLVQASDAREIDYDRLEGLTHNLVKRDVTQKDSSASQARAASTTVGLNGGSLATNGPVKLDILKQKVAEDGALSTIIFIFKRVIKNAWSLLKECIWFPINLLMISKFKLFG